MSEIVRDPLWNNIPLDDLARRLIDTPPFQRLRYVRQLGLAHLVYPGATHTRFEHALGTYHLCNRTLELLRGRGDLDGLDPHELHFVRAAALLHDIGHYPFSHALEEIGAPSHEEVASAILHDTELAAILRNRLGSDAPARLSALIAGNDTSPLQGLVSGSLDLDKIEYLKRDAFMCGVPYGEIDVDRLLHALTVLEDDSGRTRIGITDKGLAALESLLFAKYQMYRNVYWHHAVRSATAMYKRLVRDALEEGVLSMRELAAHSDESLLHRLGERVSSPLLARLQSRRLYKRAFECPAAELPEAAVEWLASDYTLLSAVEDALAREIGLAPGELLVDYPTKTQMLDLDLPVLRRDGAVVRLTGEGLIGAVNLPALSSELYRSARWLRIFTARPVRLDRGAVLVFARMSEDEMRRRVAGGHPLLGRSR
ncbi:MAG TPA: HD domain-containing protein [Gemmatimonadaceae bacterium]|nr:HD domain-containing protein [Gemmatimonadaceae bacterium]